MAKYKHYDYSQSVMLPVCLEDQLIPGTLEFAIHTLVEDRMDMSVFDNRYQNDETGRWAYDPQIVLKVVLFGYSRGLISLRRLDRVCKENIIFMALSCGQQPDHSTIAAFVSSMKGELLSLFRDVLLVCEEENLLDRTVFALNGCKLPSNASARMSGTISEIGKQGREIKSNVTDNESGMMVGSHGVIQGYNGQALVDQKRQVIVSGEVFGTGDDHHLIPPILDDAKENVKAIGHGEDCLKEKRLLADSNYHGPVNLERCEEEGLDAYIPDKDFRKRDPNFGNRPARRSKTVKRVSLEDFHYDEDKDIYICPEGKTLKLQTKKSVIDRLIPFLWTNQ